jgi:hypothetical protein
MKFAENKRSSLIIAVWTGLMVNWCMKLNINQMTKDIYNCFPSFA